MKSKQKYVNLEPEDYRTEIIKMKIKHIEKSLFSLHLMIDSQLSQADPYDEPNRYHSLISLALKVLDLWESSAECADECDLIDLEMFLDWEA